MKGVFFVKLILLTTPMIVQANSLSEISQFAGEICDKISTTGSIDRTQIVGSLNSKAQILNKLIGGAIGIDGSVAVDNMKYEGLPYEMLPEQMADARACRKKVAYMLLEQKNAIKKIKSSTAQNSSYTVKRKGLDLFLMSKPSFKSLLNYSSKENKLFRLIDNTKIALLSDEYVEPTENTSGVPVAWRKVKIVSGEHSGASGWVPVNNIKQR